jgi:hypothetical protein
VGAGLNPSVTNFANPYLKAVDTLQGVPLLLSHAVATTTTATTEIAVKPIIYVDATGVSHFYQGGRVDLSSSIPLSGQHRLALVWLKTDDTLAVSTSTAKSITIPLAAATDLKECMDAPPAVRAVPSRAFRLYGDQTTVVENDYWCDIRQWINAPNIKHQFAGTTAPTAN